MRQTWQGMSKEEKLKALNELAVQGYSAAQIAECYPGATRNAVIGMANRNRITLHGTARRRHDPEARGKVIEMPAKKHSPLKGKKKNAGPAKVIPLKPKQGPVKMMDLTNATCRRPLFKSAKGLHPDEMFFCGEVTAPESSWCRECKKTLTEGVMNTKAAIDRNGEPVRLKRTQDTARVRTFDQWRP
jgi:hypothetical protein